MIDNLSITGCGYVPINFIYKNRLSAGFGVLAVTCKSLLYQLSPLLLCMLFLFLWVCPHIDILGLPLLFASTVSLPHLTSAITSLEMIPRTPCLAPDWVLYLTQPVHHLLGEDVLFPSQKLPRWILILPGGSSFPSPGVPSVFLFPVRNLSSSSFVLSFHPISSCLSPEFLNIFLTLW